MLQRLPDKQDFVWFGIIISIWKIEAVNMLMVCCVGFATDDPAGDSYSWQNQKT